MLRDLRLISMQKNSQRFPYEAIFNYFVPVGGDAGGIDESGVSEKDLYIKDMFGTVIEKFFHTSSECFLPEEDVFLNYFRLEFRLDDFYSRIKHIYPQVINI